ncbi:MAG: PQQ-like beta-propeller repeat protein [Planctomycetales bacterium]|nr:PQQ-like beta-propeller repeat protein [Planctomycetales bacterium]
MPILRITDLRAERMHRLTFTLAAILCCLSLSPSNAAEPPQPKPIAVETEWPQFRGPRGDGTWRGPMLPETWPASGLKQLWRQPVGGGYAGVSVAEGRVFTMDRQKEPEVERVLCFDASSGKPLWQHTYPVKYDKLDYGNGPRAAPTIHGGHVYTVGALGDLRCLDAKTGDVVWKKNYLDDFAGRLPTWGFAGSPVVYGDWLILQPGGEKDSGVVAIERLTGKEVWRSLPDEAGYSTPIIIRAHDQDELVCWTPSHIRGLEARTGKLLWSFPYEITYGVSIAKPIAHDGMIFVAGYWHGSKAIRLGDTPTNAELAWEENKFLRGLMSQPLYRDGHVYLLDKQYGLTCFELQTGKKRWDDANQTTPRGRNPQATLVWLGDTDRAIILNEEGELILTRLNPEGHHEQSRTKIIGPTWAHPAFAGTRVFARSDTELICVSLDEVPE